MASRDRRIVADSDVIIQILRGDAAVRSALERLIRAGRTLAITPVSVAEVLAGARSEDEARTRVLLQGFPCLRIDRGVGDAAGRYVARYGASHGVEIADALVAACAAVHRYSLWTLDRRHYPMRELRLIAP